VQSLTQDVCTGIEIEGDDAVGILNVLWGPPNPKKAKDVAPRSFSAQYGSDEVNNAVYCTLDNSDTDRSKFFGSTSYSAVLDNCTCCIIKPHWFYERTAGQIIDLILNNGFEISGIGTFSLKQKECEEFFEYSWSKYPAYKQMLQQMTSGPWIALELRKDNAVEDFWELAGDYDPNSAHGSTIRGQLGSNQAQNAIYCSSAKSEGILECEFFFRLLDE
jgi:nucleoside-diphosphate kinase